MHDDRFAYSIFNQQLETELPLHALALHTALKAWEESITDQHTRSKIAELFAHDMSGEYYLPVTALAAAPADARPFIEKYINIVEHWLEPFKHRIDASSNANLHGEDYPPALDKELSKAIDAAADRLKMPSIALTPTPIAQAPAPHLPSDVAHEGRINDSVQQHKGTGR